MNVVARKSALDVLVTGLQNSCYAAKADFNEGTVRAERVGLGQTGSIVFNIRFEGAHHIGDPSAIVFPREDDNPEYVDYLDNCIETGHPAHVLHEDGRITVERFFRDGEEITYESYVINPGEGVMVRKVQTLDGSETTILESSPF